MRGVSTREYDEVLPRMAETVGVSRSSVSRQAIEASAEQLKSLRERRWDTVEILVIYIDGQRFGAHMVLSAVGVCREGRKHILNIEPGVLDELPDEQKQQTLNLMRAAWKCATPEEGEKRLEQLARFLERDHESAARSLREGMAEMFTLQRLKLPPSLYKCLAPTNIIESPQSGVARRTGNVTRWRDQEMVERWVASAWLLTEQHFRKIDGHRDLWALATILGRTQSPSSQEKVA
ncbi:MAG: hypothetical protein RL328_1298 [Acidobacteriota bacterium]